MPTWLSTYLVCYGACACLLQGRVVFGNYLVPHSLLIKFEKADMMYTTKPASTLSDLFMHVVKCEAENLRVMFVPSPKYNGPLDE